MDSSNFVQIKSFYISTHNKLRFCYRFKCQNK